MSGNLSEEKPNIPAHIAIIMDGNRRWAKARSLPTLEGHRRGVNTFEKLVDAARGLGISCLSAWAFSTENWKREEAEITYMFNLVREFTNYYKKKCLDEKIRFVHLGRKDRIPADIRDTILEMEESTKGFEGFTAAIGIDYGGHDEIKRGIAKLLSEGKEVTEQTIEASLDTATLPTVDLIIRTGGEIRLSGFMSWQCAYAELIFAKEFFPDFDEKALEAAISEYTHRTRTFGGNKK